MNISFDDYIFEEEEKKEKESFFSKLKKKIIQFINWIKGILSRILEWINVNIFKVNLNEYLYKKFINSKSSPSISIVSNIVDGIGRLLDRFEKKIMDYFKNITSDYKDINFTELYQTYSSVDHYFDITENKQSIFNYDEEKYELSLSKTIYPMDYSDLLKSMKGLISTQKRIIDISYEYGELASSKFPFLASYKNAGNGAFLVPIAILNRHLSATVSIFNNLKKVATELREFTKKDHSDISEIEKTYEPPAKRGINKEEDHEDKEPINKKDDDIKTSSNTKLNIYQYNINHKPYKSTGKGYIYDNY
jgi:hypothetical protein